jgi:putative CocE/NonD family hydrolase
MKVVNELPKTIIENDDLAILMPDGTRLSARLWLPEDAHRHPVPAVLEYIPYRKRDGTAARDALMHPYVAGHGYACLRVDIRGNGDSDGLMTDEYTPQELQDAVDVIAWVAAQPWCSGAVGMMGKSWGGFNCLQTAFLQPPALKAVISVCSTTDRFADDIHFKGGCLLGENFGWGAVMLSFSSRPSDPALRPDWRADWLARLEADPWLAPRWAAHQARDAYWRHGSICEDYARVQVPVLSIGGWADNYMNTVDALVRNTNAKGIVGPWVHQYPHTAVPGPAIGFLQEALRWWDRWLKGVPNGVEGDPAMRAYMLHSAPPDASAAHRVGHWVAEAAWPSPNVMPMVLGLGAGGRLGPSDALDMRIATPQHLGLAAGEFFPMGLNAEMPGDQAGDDGLSVCFDGAVLDAPLSLLGAARLELRLASDQPLGFVVARLCDVAPDGQSVRIAHGMLNLCHRHSREAPTPMTPGQMETVGIDLDQMAYRLAPGHRLRLALSTSYWPFVWPSPVQGRVALAGGCLTLPVHQGGEGWSPPAPESAPPWPHRVLREVHARRWVETDLITGTRILCVDDDLGDVENLTHGLCSGETMSERWQIHPGDPLSARATHTWEQRLSRGAWRVKTSVVAQMWADASHLHMQASLTAWEGDDQVFHRDFNESVARLFV